jgi:RimJ/RimL family protein N-acetyltransferase
LPVLQPATPEDVAAIMALERGPGLERLVGRWSAEQHLEAMRDPARRHLVWREGEEALGFVLFETIGDPNQTVRLRRIAVREPGRGVGGELIEAALGLAFRTLGAHRVELMVFEENERARRAYLKAGFAEEGLPLDVDDVDPGAGLGRARRRLSH